jgi:hypothetical protein
VAKAAPQRAEQAAPPKKVAAKRGAGRLQVAITPAGEVFVDGKSHGMAPPLKEIELAPGIYNIELRSNLRRYMATVEVKAGEASKVQHTFR